MSYNLFQEQIDYIAAITKALNTITADDQHHYIDVRLVQADTHVIVGKWSDEIGPGSWSFELLDKIGDQKV